MKNIKKIYLIFIIIIVFLFVFFIIKTSNQNTLNASVNIVNSKKIIVIDAGHGGEDGGAVAEDNTCEKNINLQIATKLNIIAKQFGYKTVMTRNSDKAIYNLDKNISSIREKKVSDMKNRLNILNSTENSVFVSIHLNKFSNKTVNGAQVFYAKNSIGSKELAEEIQKSIKNNLEQNNNRLPKENTNSIYLLKNAKNPAVIVECGFLSNENELNNLKNDEFQYKIALCIFYGITQYINNSGV